MNPNFLGENLGKKVSDQLGLFNMEIEIRLIESLN